MNIFPYPMSQILRILLDTFFKKKSVGHIFVLDLPLFLEIAIKSNSTYKINSKINTKNESKSCYD